MARRNYGAKSLKSAKSEMVVWSCLPVLLQSESLLLMKLLLEYHREVFRVCQMIGGITSLFVLV